MSRTIAQTFPLLAEPTLARVTNLGGLTPECPATSLLNPVNGRMVLKKISELIIGETAGILLCRSIPALSALESELLPENAFSTRPLRALSVNEIVTWGAVSEYSPSRFLRIRNLGRGSVLEIVSVAAENAIAAVTDGASEELAEPSVPPSALGAPDAMVPRRVMDLLVDWLQDMGDVVTVKDGLDALSTAQSLPDDVRNAWEQLCTTKLDEMPSGHVSIETSLQVFSRSLGSERAATIFWERISFGSSTLDEIGARQGVSRERIRQIQEQAKDAAMLALDDNSCRTLRWRIWDFTQRVGRAAPIDVVNSTTSQVFADTPAEWHERLQALALWYGGPYKADVRGWVYVPPLPARDDLSGHIGTDMRVDRDAVRIQLSLLGVVSASHDAWIAKFLPLRYIEDTAYLWDGSMTDKAAIYLGAKGVPMTSDEIADAVAPDLNVQATRSRLLQDSRFVRVDRRRFALAIWDMDEYTGIVDEIAEELERRGGEASVSDVVLSVTNDHSANPTSVTMLINAPRFIVVGHRIRLRTSSEPYEPKRELTDEPYCYLLSQNSCVFRFRVTDNILRGSGFSIPEALSAWLGVLPGEKRLFTFNETEQVPVTWPDSSIQPSLGSIRTATQANGAEVGDFMLIEFDRVIATARTTTLSNEYLVELPIDKRLAALSGLPSTGAVDELLIDCVGASSVSTLRDRLRSRGDADLLELLPQQEADGLSDALEHLRSVL